MNALNVFIWKCTFDLYRSCCILFYHQLHLTPEKGVIIYERNIPQMWSDKLMNLGIHTCTASLYKKSVCALVQNAGWCCGMLPQRKSGAEVTSVWYPSSSIDWIWDRSASHMPLCLKNTYGCTCTKKNLPESTLTCDTKPTHFVPLLYWTTSVNSCHTCPWFSCTIYWQ